LLICACSIALVLAQLATVWAPWSPRCVWFSHAVPPAAAWLHHMSAGRDCAGHPRAPAGPVLWHCEEGHRCGELRLAAGQTRRSSYSARGGKAARSAVGAPLLSCRNSDSLPCMHPGLIRWRASQLRWASPPAPLRCQALKESIAPCTFPLPPNRGWASWWR